VTGASLEISASRLLLVRPGLGPELLQKQNDYRNLDEGLVWIKAGEEKMSALNWL